MTAYEMRISDWSSDVCSSDLEAPEHRRHRRAFVGRHRGQRLDGAVPAVGQDHAAQARHGHFVTVALAVLVGQREQHQWHAFARLALVPVSFHRRQLHRLVLAHVQAVQVADRSEEHTSELQSLMSISYAVFCLKKITHKSSTLHTATQSSPN